MRDWDTRISELKKNIEAARNRFVIPFLDSKYLEEQVVKDIKSKPTVNEKSETKEIDKNEETKDSKKTTDKNFPSNGNASLCGVIVDADDNSGLANRAESFIFSGEYKVGI